MAAAPAFLLWFALAQADPVAQGRKALDAGDWAAAAVWFEKALGADATDWAARFHLALAQSFLQRDAEAIANYRKVLEQKPGLYEAELNLGIVLLRQKSTAEALPLLESAAQKKPKEYRPAFYLAEAYAARGEADKAEAAYRTALQAQPQSAEAAVGLARLLARAGRLAEADTLYRQASQADPEFRRALLELAGHYEQARQLDKAIALYREFPEDVGARERLGMVLMESGRPAEAIPELEKAFAQSPTTANRVALATAYVRTKQLEKATPLLEEAVAAEPNDVNLRLFFGRLLRDRRDFASAAREFFKATQLAPEQKEAWNELAGMLLLLENYPQALAALDKAQALGGDRVAYLWFRAMALDRLKDYKKALASYEEFLSLSQGRHPEEEFKARQRIRVIQKELNRR